MSEVAGRPLDQILYEAYCNKADWKSQVIGADLPGWDKLPQNIKNCWWAAADAAMDWAFEHEADVERGGKTK